MIPDSSRPWVVTHSEGTTNGEVPHKRTERITNRAKTHSARSVTTLVYDAAAGLPVAARSGTAPERAAASRAEGLALPLHRLGAGEQMRGDQVAGGSV
ncbi:hypothetical protein GCM10020256_31780 [Streptomyces thermocoprophilus]